MLILVYAEKIGLANSKEGGFAFPGFSLLFDIAGPVIVATDCIVLEEENENQEGKEISKLVRVGKSR
jgi:hypothetical protein